nr:uncharacterized mitochondrial protein AtMg00810-like [Tanacetum cinerariifolium]
MQTQTSNTLHNSIMEAGSKDRPPMLAPDNDIYSTVDACPNACEMWKSIERLKQGESINVQDLETNLYWEFRKFTSQDGESLESYYSRSQQAATRNRGKAIVNSSQRIYNQEPSMVAEDDETLKDKEIDKIMALISLSFKKIYKPTNNNLRTSSNTSRANQDNSPRINRSAGECQKSKRAKDAAYHREKMLLCKQEEAGIQLNAEQADWRDDTDDDELEDQELEAHYMYMAQLQEVSPDVDDFVPIFDAKPVQKIHQSSRGIFINQAKYAQEILKKHGITSYDSIGTPMATKHLDVDLSGTAADQTKYRSKVGAHMYLTASRPDIMHATCYCACYQAQPTEKHLTAVKWIFRYLKDTIHMRLWYPKDTGFKLTAFLDSDHAGCLDSHKSTSGGIQFLGGDKLVSCCQRSRIALQCLPQKPSICLYLRAALKFYG